MDTVQAPKAPPARPSERQALLLRTARALIATRGLRALKIRDVAAAAGCAVGTVYNEFEDLDELILAVSRDTITALAERLANLSDPDPARHLHALAQAYLDFATEHANLLRALFEHRVENGRPFPKDLIEMIMGAFALMYPPLARLLPASPTEEVAMLARTMFSAVHGIISLGLEERLVAVPQQALRQQVSLFIDTYLAGLRR